jgi:hypothetical protein
MKGHLDQLEREVVRILGDIRGLEQVSVPSAARMLGTSKKFVRKNLPVVILGPKSHRIRVLDIQAFLLRRTIWPDGEFPSEGKAGRGRARQGLARHGVAWLGGGRQGTDRQGVAGRGEA